MASYNYTADTDYQVLNRTLKRTTSTQLIDVTAMFNSYEDASKYAKGNRRDPDERKFYKASYVGQVITVYENGDISQFKINEERNLERIVPIETIKVNGQEVAADREAVVDISVSEYTGGDGVTIEETGTTKEINVMKIDCGEY